MVARELSRHVNDCMNHRDKTAVEAKKQREEIARTLVRSLNAKHSENVKRLQAQDEILQAQNETLTAIQKSVGGLQGFKQKIIYGALGLCATGLLAMILDKLSWIPLGH